MGNNIIIKGNKRVLYVFPYSNPKSSGTDRCAD